MKDEMKSAIRHMVQGLAHWMAYRNEMSNIQLIEADAILVASDILRAQLSNDYIVEREVTRKSLSIIEERQRIDLGIKLRQGNTYKCLIEFKLADATNGGYAQDVEKLSTIKRINNDIDCLVVILYRKSNVFSEPKEFVSKEGTAKRGNIKISDKNVVKVRHVCSSYASSKTPSSKKAICLEIL